jgi:hypothetical protein
MQVCWEMNGDNKMREIDGLLNAMQFFKKDEGMIITFNQRDTLRVNGNTIDLIPAFDFLAGKISS